MRRDNQSQLDFATAASVPPDWGLPAGWGPRGAGGVPDDSYLGAVNAGIAEQVAVLALLRDDDDDAPDGQLLVKFEISGRSLGRVLRAFHTLKAANTNSELDETALVIAPLLAAHHDQIYLDRLLYRRFAELERLAADGAVELDQQSRWLLAETLRKFRRAGVELADAERQRLTEINSRLAVLGAEFDTLVLAGRAAAAVPFATLAELDGLSAAELEAAAAAAQAHGLDGYLVELVNTTGQPVLARLTNRDSRRRIFEASVGRGQHVDSDVRPLILEVARLRAEKAQLLGFEHYAAYVADDGCAGTTAAVMDLLLPVARAATAKATQDAVALTTLVEADHPGSRLEPWDLAFYADKLALETAGFDEAALTPYLEFGRVLEQGVFAAATTVYGIRFEPRPDLAGYMDACLVYEMFNIDDDESVGPVGVVVIDPYARESKQGGAWMTSLADQAGITGDLPVVTVNCNQAEPAAGELSLMTWEQVITLFHEFGHALHGLFSQVEYPSRSGTHVPRDFVEFPSQVGEIWARQPWLIRRFARHWETGAGVADELVAGVVAPVAPDAGFAASELYQAMVLDQAWHQATIDELPRHPNEVNAFEEQALRAAGVWFAPVPPRYRSCYFSHIWSHDYAAGYYSYLWADVIAADAQAWFAEQGVLGADTEAEVDWPALRRAGQRFRELLLARGGSKPVMEAYREFAGRDPDLRHLLARRGLAD